MPRNAEPIDVGAMPELARLAREVARTGRSRTLRENGEAIAELRPSKRSPAKRASRAQPARRKTGLLQADDALLHLAGIGASGIPGGASGKKHEYLARAYQPK